MLLRAETGIEDRCDERHISSTRIPPGFLLHRPEDQYGG